ncbi:BURP domain-containing protein 3 [Elaeis guineensis]|uniref:BURP domain-containing protein 3 n=1 Tax=Elaeis guineensis var. tenera TaxID=51953 RepID=A0A6I9QXT0_ELAGV|nr:BURP domain-containing protein 3 [Elaeis guineensis]
MGRFVFILSLLVLVAASVGNATLPAELYWQKVLPNTLMPKIIMAQLHPDAKGGNVTIINPYRPLYYSVSTELQFPSDPALFFLEKDLHPGAGMNPGLSFTRTLSGAAFIPRAQADAIPFSSDKFPEILHRLNVLPNSELAKEVKKTLGDCEEAAIEGEHKFCATSLESMLDFVTSKLETRDIQVLATTVRGNKETAPKQRYTAAPSGVRKAPGAKLVACHPEAYPHSVYYCHLTRATKAYVVTLVGEEGTLVEAVAICHHDTSSWRSVFFKVLRVKRGTPICHFLPQDHLVWSPVH